MIQTLEFTVGKIKMNLTWNLRRYQNGDEEAIVELLKTSFRNWHGLDYWKWMYKRNPAGRSVIWVAERDKTIIGHCAIIPIRMKVGNIYMMGSQSINAATHPDYQGLGVYSSLHSKCIVDAGNSGLPLTYSFHNMNLRTYKRGRIGHICPIIHMVKVLRSKYFLNRYVRNNFLFNVGDWTVRRLFRSKSVEEGLEIKRINVFDERIDRFWNLISRNYEIIVTRDQKYLNWRYTRNPEGTYAIYIAIENDNILGFSILTEDNQEDKKKGFIIDILGFQNRKKVVTCLIQTAVEHFRQRNADLVVCMMSEKHPYKATFNKAGFIESPRRGLALTCTVNLPGHAINEKSAYTQALLLSQNDFLKEKRNWFIMYGDSNHV